MSFPRYERYKDSGVDWLGEIPEHWDLKRLILLASINDDALAEDTNSDFEIEYVDISSVTPGSKILAAESMKFGDAPSRARRRVQNDDIIVSTVRTYLRAIAPINDPPDNLIASTGFAVIRPRQDCSSIFLNYALQASNFIEEVIARSTGVSYPAINAHELGFIKLPVPRLKQDQERIGRFLEMETAKTDALIEEQRHLIEVLKEKRQSVITYAVTKGLNHESPIKDSGIEWLGKTQEHWTSQRIGTIFREVNDAGVDGLPILSVSIHHGASDKQLDDDELERKVTRSDDQTKYKRVRPGDLVYNMMRAWQGGFGTVTVEGMVSPAYVVARPSRGYLSRFVEFILRTPCAVEEMRRYSQGVTDFRLRLYWDNFKCLQLSMPPLSEQEDILAYIETETTEFDRLTEVSEQAISILLERRSALISAAVTGKIDIRAYLAKPVMKATQYSSGFAHQLLAAEILDRCNSQRMGRIKLQKLIHLCEYHGQVSEVQGDYSRKAAGPFDARAMAGISKNLKKQKWFEEVKDGERYVYRPLEKRGEHKKYLAHWQDEMPRIDEVLSLLGNFRTRECEIISTLYAAWNDLLIDGGPTDDAAILHEASSAERWHKSKEQIAPERWTKALQWMKDKGLVPVGYGKHTRHTAGQIGATTEEAHEPA